MPRGLSLSRPMTDVPVWREAKFKATIHQHFISYKSILYKSPFFSWFFDWRKIVSLRTDKSFRNLVQSNEFLFLWFTIKKSWSYTIFESQVVEFEFGFEIGFDTKFHLVSNPIDLTPNGISLVVKLMCEICSYDPNLDKYNKIQK